MGQTNGADRATAVAYWGIAVLWMAVSVMVGVMVLRTGAVSLMLWLIPAVLSVTAAAMAVAAYRIVTGQRRAATALQLSPRVLILIGSCLLALPLAEYLVTGNELSVGPITFLAVAAVQCFMAARAHTRREMNSRRQAWSSNVR